MSDRTPLRILVWHGPNVEDEDVGHAIQTLRDRLDPQLDWPVEVEPQGQVELDGTPYDTYEEYLNNFEYEADLQVGAVNVCLYHNQFVDDVFAGLFRDITEIIDENTMISCASETGDPDAAGKEAFPYAGYCMEHLTAENSPYAVVNTAMRIPLLPDPLFENFVIHETLHSILRNGNAPVEENDHSYGTIKADKATPMLTGYVETIAQNDPPSAACDLDSVPTTNRHTSTLSDCTVEEAERYLSEHFGD